MNTRPLSVAHLVFGLVFLGAAALWAIGAGTDAAAPDLALMAPAVLIGAGVIGLVAIVVNARRRDVVPDQALATTDTHDATTGVVQEEEER